MRTEQGKERAKQARAAYNKEHFRVIGANLRKEDADAFQKLAEAHGTTAGALLRQYIQNAIASDVNATRIKDCTEVGFTYLTERNTVRIMREAAQHNPDHLNPDQLVNKILDGYFTLAEKFRV